MAGEYARQGTTMRFDSAAAVFAVDLRQRIVSSTPAADAILGRRAEDGLPCYEVMRALDPRNRDWCRPDCAEVAAARDGQTPRGSALWNPECLRPRPIATLVQGVTGQPPVILHVVQDSVLRDSDLPAAASTAPLSESLTERQLEALRLLASGVAPLSIAQRLGVSPVTVRNHIQTAMERLGAHTRLEAVMLASQAGLL